MLRAETIDDFPEPFGPTVTLKLGPGNICINISRCVLKFYRQGKKGLQK